MLSAQGGQCPLLPNPRLRFRHGSWRNRRVQDACDRTNGSGRHGVAEPSRRAQRLRRSAHRRTGHGAAGAGARQRGPRGRPCRPRTQFLRRCRPALDAAHRHGDHGRKPARCARFRSHAGPAGAIVQGHGGARARRRARRRRRPGRGVRHLPGDRRRELCHDRGAPRTDPRCHRPVRRARHRRTRRNALHAECRAFLRGSRGQPGTGARDRAGGATRRAPGRDRRGALRRRAPGPGGRQRLVATLAATAPGHDTGEYTARAIATRRATPEAREGLAAFFARRPPAWVPPA